jgi:hypothetical protein
MPKKKPPLLLVKTEEKDDDEEKNLLQDEDDDSLENSCDIGETTLRKGPLAINQSGIKIVQQQQEKKYLHTEEKQKETFKRKVIV